MKPLCIYCNKQVQDYKALRHSVRWNNGEYAHSKCYLKEVDKTFKTVIGGVKSIVKNLGDVE